MSMLSYIPPHILEDYIRKFMKRRGLEVYDIVKLESDNKDLRVYRVRTITRTEYGLYWYKVAICPQDRKIIGLYDEERGEWIWRRNCPHYVYVYEDGKERLRKRTICPVCHRPL